MADEPEERETSEKEPEEGSQELIFGKYRSMEEAEKGYKELERRFHAERQAAAPEPEAPQDYGYTQLPAGGGPAQAEPEDDFDYDAPGKYVTRKVQEAIVQTLGQVRQVERVALANRRAAMRELAGHKMLADVRDEIESSLDMVDPAFLADPNQARQVVRALFGERLVERTAGEPNPQPAARKPEPRRQSPAEEPEAPAPAGEEEPAYDAEADEVLRSLGLPKKAREAATKSWQVSERGARRSR